MKKGFIIIILGLLLSCNGQIEKKTSFNKAKASKIEKFDIDKYKNLPINPNTGLNILPNGDEVQIIKNDENGGYIERVTKFNTPYTIFKSYYQNKNLEVRGQEFYGTVIGLYQEFNIKGVLVKEIDYDKNYNFSIEDLEKKMKQEYNVNIMDTKQTRSVNRSFTDPRIKFPYYQVVVNSGIASFTDYLINGTTGELFFTLKTMRGDEKDVIEEYHKTIKK